MGYKFQKYSAGGSSDGGRTLKTITASTLEEIYSAYCALENPIPFKVTTNGAFYFGGDTTNEWLPGSFDFTVGDMGGFIIMYINTYTAAYTYSLMVGGDGATVQMVMGAANVEGTVTEYETMTNDITEFTISYF